MSEFWLHSDHVIYKGQPGVLAQYIPDLKPVNGHYFAIPRTLANLQVAAYYNFSVPEVINEQTYDFPIAPPFKPLPHQKVMANFSVLHRRMFNLSDMGCVAGDTLIETEEGPVRIDTLTARGKDFKVYASTDEGVRLVPAECPFVKGFEPLYRVTCKSGRSIDVTAKHIFLTCRGWVSCADLVVGELLPKFDVDHPVSSSEPYLSKLRQDARRSTQTASDCRGYCDTLVCDEPLLRGEDSVLFSIPSQGDVLTRNPMSSRMDDLGTKCKHTARPFSDRPSNLGFATQTDRVGRGFRVAESTSKRVCNRRHTGEQFHPTSSPLQPRQLNSESVCGCAHCLERNGSHTSVRGSEWTDSLRPAPLRLAGSARRFQSGAEFFPYSGYREPPSDLSLDTVVHIGYLKTDFYYDMHVPVHENYIAHGVCSHNTMKTISTLWAADYLMRQHPKGEFRALIVAPLSTLDRVWASAIFKNFLGRRTFEILHGTPQQRSDALARDVDFFIINFEGVGTGAKTRRVFEIAGFSKELMERSDIRLAIVDEASAYKDPSTKRHRIARDILGKREYLWLLTGTPTPNAPTDAYGLAKLVNNAYGKSKTGWKMETMFQVSNFIWKPKADGYEKAAKLLSPSIRYDLKDIWDGPECVTQQRAVELTPDQKKMMADLKRDLQVTVRSGAAISAVNEAAARQKFIQISLGAVYDSDHKVHLADAKPRIHALNEILDEAPGKFLVFAPLTSVVNLLARELKHHNVAVVNGSVSQKDRSKIFADFQEGDLQGIVADPGTMAHGLDLWMARTVIWYGTSDKAELYAQANRRAHRPGQKYPVSVVQIVSNPLEIEIFRRLENNLSLQGSLLTIVQGS